MNILTDKRCGACGEVKPFSEFHKKSGSRDGLNGVCRVCRNGHTRLWRVNHPDEARERNRQWVENNPEKQLERTRRWAKNNPEKARANTRKWAMANPEKVLEKMREWFVKNPGKRYEYQRNYRAKVKGNGGKITAQEWQALKEFYNFTCLCCKRQEPEIELTLDHVISIEMGGANTIDNVQPLCQPCNSKKGVKDTDYR